MKKHTIALYACTFMEMDTLHAIKRTKTVNLRIHELKDTIINLLVPLQTTYTYKQKGAVLKTDRRYIACSSTS